MARGRGRQALRTTASTPCHRQRLAGGLRACTATDALKVSVTARTGAAFLPQLDQGPADVALARAMGAAFGEGGARLADGCDGDTRIRRRIAAKTILVVAHGVRALASAGPPFTNRRIVAGRRTTIPRLAPRRGHAGSVQA